VDKVEKDVSDQSQKCGIVTVFRELQVGIIETQ
jgi:hypothetical protein